MNNNDSNDTYWRRKLSAFMHDNPAKPLDIKHHEERALALRLVDGLSTEETFDKAADHEASAADRLPFPHAGRMKAPFDGREHAFRHPLDGSCRYTSDRALTADLIDEIAQGNRTDLEECDARTAFLARWRFWRLWAPEHAPALAFFPADTRIPDHTIWNHMGLTAAFQGCMDRDPERRPALVLFSIGPVQPMIAAARRIGDLWSGSYLLSYLAATALADVAGEYGPDHILFPSAWGQPLVDLKLRGLYGTAKVRADGGKTLWDQLWRDNARTRQRFLLPSLPNRFLVLLPAAEAADAARRMETVVREQLLEIGAHVEDTAERAFARGNGNNAFLKDRIEPQLKAALDIAWRTLPLPRTVEEATAWGRAHLPAPERAPALAALDRLSRMWASVPREDHTGYGMRNGATAWPVAFSLLSWAMDAVKNTRLFDAWAGPPRWESGREQNKDQLTGKEEAVLFAPANEGQTRNLSLKLADNPNLLRANERLGALTLVKRLWHKAYLQPRYGFKPADFRMPDTHALARGHPFSGETGGDAPQEGRDYIAVLALDGDSMGEWISGAKTPPLRDQLAAEAVAYFEKALPEGGKIAAKDFLDGSRPLNPSFHLQFSEALANFGLHAARRIVEAHDGRLIYAGGDDVLAILPASSALACARALRAAFRGEGAGLTHLRRRWVPDGDSFESDDGRRLFAESQRGFLRLHADLADGGALRGEPIKFDAIVPGPRADVSAGIAVGHARSPLQDLVRAAQAAEKRAKSVYGRAAAAVSVFKRSGEQVHWGAKWEGAEPGAGGGLDLLDRLVSARCELESRFPYKLMELLRPYTGGGAEGSAPAAATPADPAFGEAAGAIIARELRHCLDRTRAKRELKDAVAAVFDAYWAGLDARFDAAPPGSGAAPPDAAARAVAKIDDFFRLLQCAAWFGKAGTSRSPADAEPAVPTSDTTAQ